jgi:hypothetical protein
MKKLFAALVLVGALSCVGATIGQAEVISHTTFPSDFTFFDSCTGESVHIVGEVRFLSTSTVTDNTISGSLHTVFKATGTGLTSGLQYQESVAFNRIFQSSLQNGEAVITQEGAINVISPGGGNNLSSPIFVHTTLDANGNVTSSRIDQPSPTCR